MQTPEELYGNLFTDVQLKKIFPDNKTFVDCIPKYQPENIVADYEKLSATNPSNENIRQFVEDNFIMPAPAVPVYHPDINENIVEHIESLWDVLQRSADKPVEGSSLIPLPYPYIVPGGRFREVFYWDSYFTMLGLAESKRWNIIENMVENFTYLINQFGYIPNGNRSYFLSRSQPPYFSCMIELLATHTGDTTYEKYLPALLKEHNYWMDNQCPTKYVVELNDGTTLNRYYDQKNTPRPEAYAHEIELSKQLKGDASLLFRNLRAACESGWDFSGRWFTDGKTFSTINTINILPVDLNCLLYHLEITIAKAAAIARNESLQQQFEALSAQRKQAVEKYFYNKNDGWYYDFIIDKNELSQQKTIAGITPFFFKIPPDIKMDNAAAIVHKDFFTRGGVVTTLINTGQQWDSPNGWAPLQWITIKALENYGKHNLATAIAKNWLNLNFKIYKNTGKLMEKYNVVDTALTAGGGAYPSQDGFGWTNGVLLKILKMYEA